jgi:V/A-type H+-transporting ATPase subunit I
MIFGALFGSVFGEEGIIKPLLFYPMENIYTVLIGGVVLGIAFTTVGFAYSLLNAIKRRDLEEGVFGKDGLVGLLFYWIILLTALSIYNNGGTTIPIPVIIMVLFILMGLMVVKKPIANIIRGRKPLYNESVGDYYIESGFGILETLLSMLSNTISFIRVGAFALNHVGLFIAFATIADMMKSDTGSIAMIVLGNIIVMALEGMVVFIQGLRLEYYELFSKYYEGSGIEYSPVKLSCRSKPDFISPIVRINYINGNNSSRAY